MTAVLKSLLRAGPPGLLLGVVCFMPPALSAREGGRPAFQSLRYDEDYGFLRNPAGVGDAWDPVKFIRADAAGWAYFSIGGEAREMVEGYRNEFFSTADEADSVYLMQRYLLHSDFHAGDRFRIFTQFQSSFEGGKPGDSDMNTIDLHQLFADGFFQTNAETGLTLRGGRQELSFGSERLIGVREGTNNRRAFDAARVSVEAGGYQVDVFGGSPVEWDQGAFDDQNVAGAGLWGVYVTGPLKGLRGMNFDAYYIGLHKSEATYGQGTAGEERHTIGGRFFGEAEGWDFNHEVIRQTGDFGKGDIRAWSVATDHGYTFESAWGKPRLGLKAAVASGDRDRDDGRLGTFSALYPRGNYFTEAALLGPQNFMDVRPGVSVRATETVSLDLGLDFYWRQSTDDGVYRPSGSLIYRGDESGERFVGTDLSLSAEWQATRHLKVAAAYTHFFAGAFIRDAGGADVDYGSAWITYRF